MHGDISKKGWKNWADFLGVKKPQYLKIDKAKEYVFKLNLNNEHEWRKYLNTNKIQKIFQNIQIVIIELRKNHGQDGEIF